MKYRVEVFPHYQKDSIVTYTDDLKGLSGTGIYKVELEEGKPSWITVRNTTEEELYWLSMSNEHLYSALKINIDREDTS